MDKFGETFYFDEGERRLWEEELESFVPAEVFDAHTHIWSEDHALPDTPPSVLRVNVDANRLFSWEKRVFPNRRLGFMVLGSPIVGIDFQRDREWCVQETRKLPESVCAVLVTPESDPEKLASDAVRLGFKALKPYLVFARHTVNSPISELIPERLLEVAEQCHLMVVLHVSKPECFNDPVNLTELEYFTRKYPHVTWQLAHCARSFNSILLEKSIHRLRHMDHICYDLSAVCDPYSMYLLFKYEDRSRLMYGSDNISAGGLRGVYAPYGRTWGFVPASGTPGTTFICYEQLRAMRRAALMAALTEDEIRHIFWHNARCIYGIGQTPDNKQNR